MGELIVVSCKENARLRETLDDALEVVSLSLVHI